MTRRSFLKTLVAAATVTSVDVLSSTLPKIAVYPKVTYELEYVPQKLAYLHVMYFEHDNVVWNVAEYTDSNLLDEELSRKMFSELKTRMKEITS